MAALLVDSFVNQEGGGHGTQAPVVTTYLLTTGALTLADGGMAVGVLAGAC